jgi:hypothetical protein
LIVPPPTSLALCPDRCRGLAPAHRAQDRRQRRSTTESVASGGWWVRQLASRRWIAEHQNAGTFAIAANGLAPLLMPARLLPIAA